MHTLEQIQQRLAAIATEMDAEGADIAALTQETNDLIAERTQIMANNQQRQQLRDMIARGQVPATQIGTVTPEPAAPAVRFAVDSAEYRSAYLRNLQGLSLSTEERAAVTASAAIPTVTMNKIIARMDQYPTLRLVDISYIPGNVAFPAENSVGDASWVAAGTSATDSADSLKTAITLSAYVLIKTVEINANVQAMAIDAFEAWLVERLGNKINYALNNAIWNGTGTNQATGIATTKSVATGTYTKEKMTYADLMTIIGSLGSKYMSGAAFSMPTKLFFTDIIGMVDTTGQPIVHADVESPAKFNILGWKVNLDDCIDADNLYFGDLKEYKLNIAQNPEIKSDDSAAFRSGSRVYRAMCQADGKLAEADAIIRYTREA